MRFKIHYPKALVLTLLGIVGISSALVIQAAGQESYSEPVFPAVPKSARVNSEEEQRARDIVDQSGIVKEINGDQDWVASGFYPVAVGSKEAVKLEASWPNPVTSSGPWINVICQGTRKTEGVMEFSDVTKLTLHVDLAANEVIGTAIAAPPEDSKGAVPEAMTSEHKIRVYDTTTGQLVYDGAINNIDAKCAPGTEEG